MANHTIPLPSIYQIEEGFYLLPGVVNHYELGNTINTQQLIFEPIFKALGSIHQLDYIFVDFGLGIDPWYRQAFFACDHIFPVISENLLSIESMSCFLKQGGLLTIWRAMFDHIDTPKEWPIIGPIVINQYMIPDKTDKKDLEFSDLVVDTRFLNANQQFHTILQYIRQ
jgi:MinD-like ATPase involved in chromosome partitioning or flagellar assembly